jgi:hypothetical protein
MKPLNIAELDLNHANENTEDGMKKTIQKKEDCCEKCRGEYFCLIPMCSCHWKKVSQKEPEEWWEDRFDKLFCSPFYEDDNNGDTSSHEIKCFIHEIKCFIRHLLSQQRTQTIEEIKKLKRKKEFTDGELVFNLDNQNKEAERLFYNAVLDEIISSLK